MKYNKVVRNNYLMGFTMKIQLFLGYKRHLVDVYLQISQMFKIPVLYVFKELCGYTYSIEFCMKYNKDFLKKFPFSAQCERRRSEEENVRSSKTVTSCDMR